MLVAAVYSYMKGSTSNFNVPYDSDGRGCSVDYPAYPYIYFPSPQVDVSRSLILVIVGNNLRKKLSKGGG